MSRSRTLSVQNKIGGVLTDLTSCRLNDPTSAFGVKRTDTNAVIVAAGTAFTHDGTGLYSIAVTGLLAGVEYQAYVETIYAGETSRDPVTWTAVDSSVSLYCTLEEADAIAAALPLLASYKAASSDARTAALAQASIDIDAAGPWQGRKYDLWTPQELEFPRVPYQSSSQVCGYGSLLGWLGSGAIGVQIWDWDAVNNVAVVPAKIKRACLFQADSILKGDWQKALDAAAMGVEQRTAGSVSISYRDPLAVLQYLGGGSGSLCRASAQLLKKYQISQGRIL